MKTLFRTKGVAHDLIVTRNGATVTLWSAAGLRHTVFDIAAPHLPGLEYARNMLTVLAFCPKAQSCLVLGLGGGSIPRMLLSARPQIEVEAVEYDPAVVERYDAVDDRAMRSQDAQRSFLVKAGELAVRDGVGRENRGQPSLDLTGFHSKRLEWLVVPSSFTRRSRCSPCLDSPALPRATCACATRGPDRANASAWRRADPSPGSSHAGRKPARLEICRPRVGDATSAPDPNGPARHHVRLRHSGAPTVGIAAHLTSCQGQWDSKSNATTRRPERRSTS